MLIADKQLVSIVVLVAGNVNYDIGARLNDPERPKNERDLFMET